MRLFGKLLGYVVLLVIALVVVAFFLPRNVEVSRSITIDAPAADIFPHVNSMQKTEAWSPWLDRDPNVVLTYEGPEVGVGNKLIWASEVPEVGNGTQEITASIENERVETALDFGPMGTADASFVLVADGDGTEVTWGFVTDLGMNPVARYMGLMFDGWVGGDYETGLSKLKALVEGV
ncbi:MAG: SRPBCC family protein [Pseudomonadota bacterium]